jgi:hypothetical protein
MDNDQDDEFELPPAKDHFDFGFRRNAVKFLPASVSEAETPQQKNSGSILTDFYLSRGLISSEKPSEDSDVPNAVLCEYCKILVDPAKLSEHQTSFKHELNRPHIYPPSAIDRTRKGVAFLQSKGWDPDSRKGLGASGEGILYPIKPKENSAKQGLGAPEKPAALKKQPKTESKVEKKMNPKQKRKQEEQEKKWRDRQLHDLFYGRDNDLDAYFGSAK